MSIMDRKPIAALPDPAERLRLRTLFGVTQDELADEIGVTRKTIYAWEHGKGNPTGQKRSAYSGILLHWTRSEARLMEEIRNAGDMIDPAFLGGEGMT